jgi:hypothetical protein
MPQKHHMSVLCHIALWLCSRGITWQSCVPLLFDYVSGASLDSIVPHCSLIILCDMKTAWCRHDNGFCLRSMLWKLNKINLSSQAIRLYSQGKLLTLLPAWQYDPWTWSAEIMIKGWPDLQWYKQYIHHSELALAPKLTCNFNFHGVPFRQNLLAWLLLEAFMRHASL